MEQNVVDIKSLILRWGLYAGLAAVGFSVLVFVAGLTYSESKAVGFIVSVWLSSPLKLPTRGIYPLARL